MAAAVVAQGHKNKPQCDRRVTSGPLMKDRQRGAGDQSWRSNSSNSVKIRAHS